MKKTQVAMGKREKVVVLGGREFVIRPLPMAAARDWRKKHSKFIQNVIGLLQQAEKIQLQDESGAWNVATMGRLLNQISYLLIGAMDLLTEALFDYSPELQAEREWIEANADDEEAIAALWEVVQLAFPFGSLLETVSKIGGAKSGTTLN